MRRLIHRLLAAVVAVFNRQPWTSERLALLPRGDFYEADGLWTNHTHGFVDDPEFRRAFARAEQAVGDVDMSHMRWRIHTVLWAAERCARLDGAFVECGTARGFTATAICEHLGWEDRLFYLLDTFQPGEGAMAAAYANGPDDVAKNFAEWPGVQLVVGTIPDTLERVPDGPVAFLHVDLNHPDPEAAAVRHFWPRMVAGGVMIFDDYGFPTFTASRDSADRLAAELGFTILCLPTGQGLVVK